MSEQFGLFDDVAAIDAAREVEARRLAKLARFRTMVLERDCCTGYREELWVELPWEPADGERRRPAYRCGRCGEPEATWAASLSHDAGYGGCNGTDPIPTGKDVLGNVLDPEYRPPAIAPCPGCGSEQPEGSICSWCFPCEECGAGFGEPCRSKKKARAAEDVPPPHSARHNAAATEHQQSGPDVHYPQAEIRVLAPMDGELLDLRHDRLHHPDCARCGHAWGTHAYMRVGDTLPEEASCHHCCGCDGYVAPEGHTFPWDEEGG